mmetsp:Transcript_104186/g.334246  ORF Transcript_104186/g.334246 Transcript_104186/m.334246 type:complete len:225 (-) Transcript_104186:818-1492(-)
MDRHRAFDDHQQPGLRRRLAAPDPRALRLQPRGRRGHLAHDQPMAENRAYFSGTERRHWTLERDTDGRVPVQRRASLGLPGAALQHAAGGDELRGHPHAVRLPQRHEFLLQPRRTGSMGSDGPKNDSPSARHRLGLAAACYTRRALYQSRVRYLGRYQWRLHHRRISVQRPAPLHCRHGPDLRTGCCWHLGHRPCDRHWLDLRRWLSRHGHIRSHGRHRRRLPK